jgi:hypothetical protein
MCSQKLLVSTVDNLRRDGLYMNTLSADHAPGSSFYSTSAGANTQTSTSSNNNLVASKKGSLTTSRSSHAGSLTSRLGSVGNSLMMELEMMDEDLKVRCIL